MFLLFAGPDYHPQGGWHDCLNVCVSLAEAIEVANHLNPKQFDWWHVVDVDNMEMVAEGRTIPRVLLET